jgi:hypothetical protein
MPYIDSAAAAWGVDPQLMRRIAHIESSGNPFARTGSYKGLFQLSDDEFNKYGGGDIFSAADNSNAAARKLAAESSAFRQQYGRDPTATDIYLTHQQGQGGYAAHTSNPDQPAWRSMLSTGEGRQKGEAWAKKAIWGNVPDNLKAQYGSVDNITSQQFIDLWRNKVEGGGALSFAAEGTRNHPAQSFPIKDEGNTMAMAQAPALSPSFATGEQGVLFGGKPNWDLLGETALWMKSANNPELAAQAAKPSDNFQFMTTADGSVIAVNRKNPSQFRQVTPPNKPFGFMQGADGTIYRTNPLGGTVDPLVTAPKPEEFGVVKGDDGSIIRYGKRGGAVDEVKPGIPRDQRTYLDERAKAGSKTFDVINDNANKARADLSDVQQLTELAKKGTIWQGTGGEYVHKFQKLGATFGIGVEGASDADAFNALTKQFALKLRNPHEGAGMPGSLSNQDLKFLQASAPGLSQTREGNVKLLEYMGRIQQRQLEVQKFAREYAQKNGRIDDNFHTALSEWAEANPLFKEGQGLSRPLSGTTKSGIKWSAE